MSTAPIARLSGQPGSTGLFEAGSRTADGVRYRVVVGPERITCSCRGYAHRRACWHVGAVAAELERERRARRAVEASAAEQLAQIGQEFGCG